MEITMNRGGESHDRRTQSVVSTIVRGVEGGGATSIPVNRGDSMKLMSGVLIIILLVSGICIAQSKKIPVAVNHVGDDSVGQGVAFALKEAIRASQSFRLVDYEPAAKLPQIVVFMVSIGANENISAIGSTIVYNSLTMPGEGIFIREFVQICSEDRLESCARKSLPNIDNAVDFLRRNWPSLSRNL